MIGFGSRIDRVLERHGIHSMVEIIKLGPDGLLAIPGLGISKLKIIQAKIAELEDDLKNSRLSGADDDFPDASNSRKVEELPISQKALAALCLAGINYIEDLKGWEKRDIQRLDGVSKKDVKCLSSALMEGNNPGRSNNNSAMQNSAYNSIGFISDLMLSHSLSEALRNSGMVRIGDILELPISLLIKLPGVGPRGANAIYAKMHYYLKNDSDVSGSRQIRIDAEIAACQSAIHSLEMKIEKLRSDKERSDPLVVRP